MTRARDLADFIATGALADGSLEIADTSGLQAAIDAKVATSDIGTTVQAYDSNLNSFVSAFTLPTSDGTADQVLTTNGSGTISFADAGGGTHVLIDEVNVTSSVNSVELTGMDSTYKTYVVIASETVKSLNEDTLLTIKQGGSYITTGYYGSVRHNRSDTSTLQTSAIANASSFRWNGSSPYYEGYVMYIYGAGDASLPTHWILNSTGSQSSGTEHHNTTAAGFQTTAGATTAIKFAVNGGVKTFESGTFRLYGIGA